MTDLTIAFETNNSYISNKFVTTSKDKSCTNQFGNYFPTCSNISAQWGNTTETIDKDVFSNPTPCTKLFNNSTKRKSVVFYNR